MSALSFNTANDTYRKLVGNGTLYAIPPFQRDYSWTDAEWDDLWADLMDVLEQQAESAHYMGYLVLQSSDSKNFLVIDGQQRLITLSLLMLAVLNNLNRLINDGIDEDNNKQRMEQLRNSFIGYLNPVTLMSTSKLTLNRNNDSLYQNYLLPLRPTPQRGLKPTEKLLRNAFDWFDKKVFNKYGKNKDGKLLAQFADSLTDKLFFTVITVSDELNAYKVFETLNARGVKLSSTDLLKNYLFSVVHKNKTGDERELQGLESRWGVLVDKMGSESFPDFLRTHWNSRNKFVRHSDLFKKIRERIINSGDVFALLSAMEDDADIYAALSNPEDELWKDNQQKTAIGELKMFGVKQVFSLLLAAYRKFDNENFNSVLKACSVISFRYNVIGGLNPNEQERVYNIIAEKIAKDSLQSAGNVIRELRVVYTNDEQFKTAFAEKQLKTTQSRNNRIVKYILFKIEKQLSGNTFDIDSDTYSIEHILPENLSEGWEHITDKEHEQAVYRLGNMTLLATTKNRKLGNSPFDVKRPVFEESSFEITKRIAEENNIWNIDRIANRQRWMAIQAVGIWKIIQLN